MLAALLLAVSLVAFLLIKAFGISSLAVADLLQLGEASTDCEGRKGKWYERRVHAHCVAIAR